MAPSPSPLQLLITYYVVHSYNYNTKASIVELQ